MIVGGAITADVEKWKKSFEDPSNWSVVEPLDSPKPIYDFFKDGTLRVELSRIVESVRPENDAWADCFFKGDRFYTVNSPKEHEFILQKKGEKTEKIVGSAPFPRARDIVFNGKIVWGSSNKGQPIEIGMWSKDIFSPLAMKFVRIPPIESIRKAQWHLPTSLKDTCFINGDKTITVVVSPLKRKVKYYDGNELIAIKVDPAGPREYVYYPMVEISSVSDTVKVKL